MEKTSSYVAHMLKSCDIRYGFDVNSADLKYILTNSFSVKLSRKTPKFVFNEETFHQVTLNWHFLLPLITEKTNMPQRKLYVEEPHKGKRTVWHDE